MTISKRASMFRQLGKKTYMTNMLILEKLNHIESMLKEKEKEEFQDEIILENPGVFTMYSKTLEVVEAQRCFFRYVSLIDGEFVIQNRGNVINDEIITLELENIIAMSITIYDIKSYDYIALIAYKDGKYFRFYLHFNDIEDKYKFVDIVFPNAADNLKYYQSGDYLIKNQKGGKYE